MKTVLKGKEGSGMGRETGDVKVVRGSVVQPIRAHKLHGQAWQ